MRFLFLLSIADSTVHAHDQPKTPAVIWLMDEPVSLWDLGILRLEHHLQHTFVSSVRTRVRYTRNDKLLIMALLHALSGLPSAISPRGDLQNDRIDRGHW